MIDEISEIGIFKELSETWDSNVFSMEEPNPSILSDFIFSWWHYLNKNKKLKIYFSFDMKLGLPMYSYRPLSYGFKNVLRLIGDGASNYSESFSSDVNSNMKLMKFLTSTGKNDIIRFDRLRESSLLFNAIEKSNLPGYKVLINEIGKTFYICGVKSVDDYLLKLPKKLRYHIRKGLKKTACNGGLEIIQPDSLEDINVFWDEYVKLAVNSFKARGKKNSFELLSNQKFYKEFLLRLYKRDLLDCHVLKYQGNYLAIHFGVMTPKTMHYILTAHNIKYSDLSPGHLLIYSLLQNINNRTKLDLHFGRNVLYKKQWANEMEKVYEVFIFKNTIINNAILKLRSWNKR